MRRLRAIGVACAAASLIVAACADDDPTGVGGDLVPGGSVRTFEVVLDASRAFESSAAFVGYHSPWQSGRVVVAEDAGGRIDAHVLARFGGLPATVEYEDSAGDSQVDSDPTFMGGELIVPVDTTAMRGAAPVTLRLLDVDQEWHAPTANWTMRVDSGGVQLPWSEPGATGGEFVDTATWTPGVDSLAFAVDSQTVAAWTNTDDDARGALIVAETADARFFGSGVSLRLNARPSERPDTVVTATLTPVARTFILDSVPTAATALWVGGVPSWRAFLRFNERLDTVTVTTPDGSRTYRVGDLAVTFAAVSVVPVEPPAGLQPEDTLSFGARVAYELENVPLSRSPVGATVTGDTVRVPRDSFDPAAPAGRYEFAATTFVSDLIQAEGGESVPRTIALMPRAFTFGIGAFAPPGAPAAIAPRLHLVVTVAEEAEIQ